MRRSVQRLCADMHAALRPIGALAAASASEAPDDAPGVPSFRPRGVANIGNTCFVNCVLQALVGCPGVYAVLAAAASTLRRLDEVARARDAVAVAPDLPGASGVEALLGLVPRPPATPVLAAVARFVQQLPLRAAGPHVAAAGAHRHAPHLASGSSPSAGTPPRPPRASVSDAAEPALSVASELSAGSRDSAGGFGSTGAARGPVGASATTLSKSALKRCVALRGSSRSQPQPPPPRASLSKQRRC